MTFEAVKELWESTFGSREVQLEGLTAEASYRPFGDGGDALLDVEVIDFEPLELLARGGMGEVFRACQVGLGREVALKRIRGEKRHIPDARRSFLAEAVITGRLEHPNIVPVYALGSDERGEIFLAMKLVGGKSWKQVLREGRANLQAQLETLNQVCNAVAFAHSRQFIHNDLKPGNVMLGEFGEVLVFDWGLAVSVSDSQDADPRVRHKSSIKGPFGTPCYIAPELAMGRGSELGPWTDVYLLGAVLFEILTGHPPHMAGSLLDSLRHAMETDAPSFDASVPPELARLCKKALARDPKLRHPDAGAFQKDLQNYLKHWESTRIAGIAKDRLEVSRSQAAREDARELRDDIYEGFAQSVAGFAQSRSLWKENQAANLGERSARLAYARAALDLGDLGLAEAQLTRLHALFPGVPTAGPNPDSLDDLHGEVLAARRSELREQRGRERLKLGLLVASLLLFLGLGIGLYLLDQKNTRIEAQNASILESNAQIQHEKEAADAQRQEAEEQRRFADRRGEIAQKALEQMVHQVQSRLLDDLADAHAHRTAKEILQLALVSWRELRDANVDEERVSQASAMARLRIGDLLYELDGDLDGALVEYQAAAETFAGLQGPEGEAVRRDNALVQLRLASIYRAQGQLQAAHSSCEAGLELMRALYRAQPQGYATRRDLVSALLSFGEVLAEQGDRPAMVACFEEAAGLARSLVHDHQGDPTALRDLSKALLRVGQLNQSREAWADARAAYEEGLAVARALLARAPGNPLLRHDVSKALDALAAHWLQRGSLEHARELYEQSLDIHAQLLRLDPGNVHEKQHMASTLASLAQLHWLRDDPAPALELFGRALRARRELAELDASNAHARNALAALLLRTGSVRRAAGELDTAEVMLRESVELRRELASLDASSVHHPLELIRALHELALLNWDRGDLEGFAALRGEALERARVLQARQPENLLALEMLAYSIERKAELDASRSALDAALAGYVEAVSLRRLLLDRGPERDVFHHNAVANLLRLGALLDQAGQAETVREVFREAVERCRDYLRLHPRSQYAAADFSYALKVAMKSLAQLPAGSDVDTELLALAEELRCSAPDALASRQFLESQLKGLAHTRYGAGALAGSRPFFEARAFVLEELASLVHGESYDQAEKSAVLELGDVQRLTGGYEEALASYARVEDRAAPGDLLGVRRGLCFAHLGKLQEAQETLAGALEGDASHFSVLFLAALGTPSPQLEALAAVEEGLDSSIARLMLEQLSEPQLLEMLAEQPTGDMLARVHSLLGARHDFRAEREQAQHHYGLAVQHGKRGTAEVQWAMERVRQWQE